MAKGKSKKASIAGSVHRGPGPGPGPVPGPVSVPRHAMVSRSSDTGAVVVRGRHYSLGEVARGTGINRPHITRIFNGQRGLTLASAERISAFLGVPLESVVSLLKRD